MKRWTTYLFLTAILLLGSGTAVKSQHCPYDMTSIIVVTIHEKESIKNIPNIRITLIDSLGNPFIGTIHKNEQLIQDTLRFWQNPNKKTFNGYLDNEDHPTQINFPFAKDNYVFVCAHNFPAAIYYIKVEEIDGKADGEYYPVPGIKLYEQDKYSLCGTFDLNEYYPRYYGARIYKPIDIIMQRKK